MNAMDEATKDFVIRQTVKVDGDYQSNESIIQEIKDTVFDPEKNPITDMLQKRLRNIGDVFKSK